MFELSYMESYLMPVFFITMAVVIVGVGLLARRGGN